LIYFVLTLRPEYSWAAYQNCDSKNMMNPAFAMINQQFIAGCAMGQQGMNAEQGGNLSAAIQFYAQAIASIQQSMFLAQQSGVYIPDNVYFSASFAHFSAARVKNALGWGSVAWNDLNQSLTALNQAITLNSNVVQYHVFAGTVLMTLGNLLEAERAFMTALRLNPSEPWSQYMLAFLNSARGNTAAASHYYYSLQQKAPNLPQMPPITQPPNSSPQGETNWIKTTGEVADMLTKVFGAIGGFQNLMQ
jgi:tetratricopeptide (TPR) repeat protein